MKEETIRESLNTLPPCSCVFAHSSGGFGSKAADLPGAGFPINWRLRPISNVLLCLPGELAASCPRHTIKDRFLTWRAGDGAAPYTIGLAIPSNPRQHGSGTIQERHCNEHSRLSVVLEKIRFEVVWHRYMCEKRGRV